MKKSVSKKIKDLTVGMACVIIGCSCAFPFLSYATTQKDVDDANSKLESLKEDQSNLSSDLADLNNKLTASGQKIANYDQQINTKQMEIDQLQVEITQLDAQKTQQYQSMKLRIKFMYEKSSNNTLDILLSSKSLADLLVRTEYIQKITEYDRNMLQQLEDIYNQEQAANTKLNADMTQLSALKDSAAKEQENLRSLLTEKQSQIDSNSSNISQAEQLALQYEKDLENQKIAQEKAEAEAASREAAENAANVVTPSGPISYDATDLSMLAAIIECEAGNQSYQGKLAVGSVVINRVNSPRFANSISGVLYASGQFSPVASGRFAIVLQRGANAECTKAAQEVLNGHIVINALYFHVYHSEYDTYGTVIGDHIFY